MRRESFLALLAAVSFVVAAYSWHLSKVASAEVAALRLNIETLQRQSLAQPSTVSNNATMEGSTVNVGGDSVKREWLQQLPELRTSELSFLLDVTNETITNRIQRDENGAMWFPHAGERYPVRPEGNTFIYGNPFAEP